MYAICPRRSARQEPAPRACSRPADPRRKEGPDLLLLRIAQLLAPWSCECETVDRTVALSSDRGRMHARLGLVEGARHRVQHAARVVTSNRAQGVPRRSRVVKGDV